MKINELVCGDNVVEMKKMPDQCIDLTVTSPPYDDLRKYKGFSFDFFGVASELYRVTKDGGVVVWVVSDQTKNGDESGNSFRQALHFKSIGFSLYDTMIYHRWSGPLTHRRYEQEFEYMFVFSKGTPKTFNPIKIPCTWYGKDSDRTGQNYVIHDELNRKLRSGKERNNILPTRIKGNIWKMNNSSQAGERYGHPAPFPEELAHDHVSTWSNEGDTVLDPFVGSGTTPVVCKRLKRDFYGIDCSSEYIDIAKNRLNSS